MNKRMPSHRGELATYFLELGTPGFGCSRPVHAREQTVPCSATPRPFDAASIPAGDADAFLAYCRHASYAPV